MIGSASNGAFLNSFWLVLEGFNQNKFNSLGIGTPILSGTFAALPQLTLQLDVSGVEFGKHGQSEYSTANSVSLRRDVYNADSRLIPKCGRWAN